MFFLYIILADRLIITEVMSNVKGSETTCGDRNEFVELYNASLDTVDVSNYLLSDFDAPADEICAWEDENILVKYPAVRIHSTIIHPFSYAVILDREYTSEDTAGGNVQPYAIPDSTLIMTTDDTSIGDGLSCNDPLILFSAVDSCTTSFGTPYDSLDGFPYDPGDGISWEMIELADSDFALNWYPCIDLAGCTPGKTNSTVNASDLAVDRDLIDFTPGVLKIGENASVRIGVINQGLRATNEYTVAIFDDGDRDSLIDAAEILTELDGEPAAAFDTVFLYYVITHPAQGDHNFGFLVSYAADKDITNNLAIKNLKVLGSVGELCLSPQIFSPDGDGSDDRLQIDYRLPESDGELTISVYDSRGSKVCEVCKKMPASSDRGTFFWDGKGRNGNSSSGMYIVYLEYKYRGRLARAKQTAVLAR